MYTLNLHPQLNINKKTIYTILFVFYIRNDVKDLIGLLFLFSGKI